VGRFACKEKSDAAWGRKGSQVEVRIEMLVCRGPTRGGGRKKTRESRPIEKSVTTTRMKSKERGQTKIGNVGWGWWGPKPGKGGWGRLPNFL